MAGSARVAGAFGALFLFLGVGQLAATARSGSIADVSSWRAATWGGVVLLAGGVWYLCEAVGRSRSPADAPAAAGDPTNARVRIETVGGEYAFTDDAVRVRFDGATALRHLAERRPRLAGAVLLLVAAQLLGLLGAAASSPVVRLLPPSMLLPSLVLLLATSALAALLPAVAAFRRLRSLRRRLLRTVGTRTLSTDDAIAREAVESVVLDRHGGVPVMYVVHRTGGTTAAQVAYLLEDADDAVERAELLVGSAGIETERADGSTAPGFAG